MGFGDLKTKSGQEALNSYLADKSYVEGFQPSQSDVVVFEAASAPPADLAHALRWYNHILSYGDTKSSFPGEKKPLSAYGPPTTVAKPSNDGDDDSDDDSDVDLFGSDTEEEKAQKEACRKQREAENAKKPKKPPPVAKSNIILDVKPWDDETDMVAMEKHVRSITKDGLLWGSSKLVPLAFGIKKLQISCVVEDDKIDTEFLEEEICKFADYVQSMDIAAFNKV